MALLEGVSDRHKAVQDAARRFEIDHLTNPDARQVGMAAARFASEMLQRIRKDDPELTKALDKLADARDGFIRALIYEKDSHA
jgi:hypothetical protein